MLDEKLKKEIMGYLDYLLENSTAERPLWNKEIEGSSQENKWNYIDGCMLLAVLSLYEKTKEEHYFSFVKDFIDYFVTDDGDIKTYSVEEYNLDSVNCARALFPIYEKTGEEKYKKALDLVRSQLETQPRTASGNFWHKKIYPDQVWLDGLFMAQPFYLRYETQFCKMAKASDVLKQYQNVERFMKDPETGLYYHGYDESRKMPWANPITGCSQNFWLRSLGWFALSLVDTLSELSETLYYEKRYLMSLLKDLIDSILKYQDEGGMFWQVANFPGREGNYLETSGTALIACAILRGVRLHFLPEKYLPYGEKAFYGIVDKYFSYSEKDGIKLGGICLVAGLGGKNMRDGSYEYYLSEPVVENESKGVAPFLMTFVELLREDED